MLPHPCLWQCPHKMYILNLPGCGNQNTCLYIYDLIPCIPYQVTLNTTTTKVTLSGPTAPDMGQASGASKGNSTPTKGYESKYKGTGRHRSHTSFEQGNHFLFGNREHPRDHMWNLCLNWGFNKGSTDAITLCFSKTIASEDRLTKVHGLWQGFSTFMFTVAGLCSWGIWKQFISNSHFKDNRGLR